MSLNNEELRTSNDNPFNSQKSKIPLSPCKLAGGKRKLGNGEYTNKNGVDPFYITGFTDAEGCFLVDVQNSNSHKTGKQVILKFQISQNIRDENLLKSTVHK